MKTDLTMPVTRQMLDDAARLNNEALVGHIGTHFDVMDKDFPLEYTTRRGIVFDVSAVSDRDIEPSDIDMSLVGKDMFVAFFTGFSSAEKYGTARYFKEHPQLSGNLIDALLNAEVSIIGLDFAGVRRGTEHIPTDQRAADRGVFIIENLVNLDMICKNGSSFTAHTYPMNCTGITGLPCRVIGEI